LNCGKRPYIVEIGRCPRCSADGDRPGRRYRGLPIENLTKFNGAGVYYFATPMEAQLCKGEPVMVVGGGNSAGRAAVFSLRTEST
jgi:thioredoxin reductase (NADPH)